MTPSYPVHDFFIWIGHIFEDFFFIPLDYIRSFQDQTWWGGNLVNWVFLLILFVLLGYWLYKLKGFHEHDRQHKPETHR